jgi:UDP-N-acetyl-D-mannosaminuronic acid dehydrogenase
VVTDETVSTFCEECGKSDVLEPRLTGESNEICVVGMGYVGSSLSAVLAENGFTVYGVDTDTNIIETIESGQCPIEEDKITELFEEHAAKGHILGRGSCDVIDKCELIIVTVGTPLAKRDADLSSVKAATRSIGPYLDRGNIVIYRSTLPTGATENTIRPILDEESELVAGTDYSLAFCPERMAEGNAYNDITNLPVVVGGLTDSCLENVEAFWHKLGHETVAVSSPRAAELAKLADNWWIDLNIALANELALLSEEVGVDALEVIRAANTLPKGEHNVNILFPGAGVGGSCLVKDPWFVANLAEDYGIDLQTPRVSREVNNRMPSHMVDLINEGPPESDNQSVAVLGYAYKRDTDDTRNTPAKKIIELLDECGVDVRITDPYVRSEDVIEEVGHSVVRLPDALQDAHTVAIVTGHQQYKDLSPEQLIDYIGGENFSLVDGRHVFHPSDFAATDVQYRGVGRGVTE